MPNDFDTSQYPLGSTHPYVLYNNAGNEDLFANDMVNETWVDRPPFNRVRKTLFGMEQEFLRALAKMGYETTYLTYVDGSPLQVDRPTQLITRGDSVYAVKLPATFPVTLTGTWATDAPLLVDVGDQSLRTALANGTDPQLGAALPAFEWGTAYSGDNIGSALRLQRNIRQFGAVANDGVTNDIAAFQAAAAAGPGIIDARGLSNCLLNGTITVGANQTWLLSGSDFTTANDDEAVFLISLVSNASLIGPFRGTGTGGATSTGASFIRINDAIDWLVDSPRLYAMPGYGIYITPGAGASDRAKHGEIRNPIIRECNIGVLDVAGTGAEYYTIVNPMITFCYNTGLVTSAGNVNVLGGHIVDNVDGVRLSNGSNHSHGGFVGVNINHNTQFNIFADHITNGETFIGCHMYGGSAGSTGEIFLDNCRGIVFDGGHLACRIYNYEAGAGAGVNVVRNMFCLGTYGEVQILDDVGARPKNLIVQNCYGPGSTVSGISINDPSFVYVHVRRELATTQALSGATTLIFPVAQANGDRRRAHNLATGITTIPLTTEGGQYRIDANLYFTATSGLTAAGSNIQILVNGIPRRLYVPDVYSGTIAVCPVVAEMFLNPGDTVSIRATMVGTGVLFGGATWDSGFSVSRIA